MTELKLEGLNCNHCAAKIEKSLQGNIKLSDVSLSFAAKKLFLNSKMKSSELKQMIQDEIDKIENGISVESENDESLEKTEKNSALTFFKIYGRTIIGAIIVLSLLFIEISSPYKFILYLVSYSLIASDIVFKAVKKILKGEVFDENFLMTIATIGAFALGEFTEAVAVMLFYKIGEAFQDYAVNNSRRSITSLLNIKAEFANLVSRDTTIKVKPQSLKIDDHILILAGEKVPVDGLVLNGASSVNTSALTGESLPRFLEKGDDVLSGFINIDAPLTIKVNKLFKDSTVSRILQMVENATSKKAKTEQFITKFAKIYTPIVVFSALLIALIPPLLGMGMFSQWISRALIFLVISCPCALVLSVPLGFFGGLGKASREGILIKGGNYLEALNGIDTFVFDKTGTLTKGNFAIKSVSGKETLELAAQLEQHSTHPIAKSIIKAYGGKINNNNIEAIEEFPGRGLSGIYKGKKLHVGNERLMETMSIEYESKKHSGTAVHVAYHGKYQGAIIIYDELKEGAKELSSQLKAKGAKELIMLTGDQKNIAESVAKELSIQKVYSELQPQDKMNIVEGLMNEGKKVLFVGDGINDAPVLAMADIGVAMGGLGSDAAIEAADMVFMTDEPTKIIRAKEISKKTRVIVMQNIIFALAVKVFFLSLAMIGQANMYEAIFADVGVTLLAVLNSLRILR